MLTFICEKEIRDKVMEELVKKLAKEMELCEITTLAANYYDSNLTDELCDLFEVDNDNSFVFDKNDLLGEEPYGMVYDFYESLKILLNEIKIEFPALEIKGYVFINDTKFDCCYREGVKATKKSAKIKYTRQLPCTKCGKWVETKDIIIRLGEGGEEWDGRLPFGTLPQGLRGKGECCICSSCV